MGPIDLQAHSCEHCRRLIIDINERKRWQSSDGDDSGDMSRDKALFDFTLWDIRNADADGCNFCAWLLDEEVISRDAVLRHFPLNLPSDDPFFGAMLALQDQAFAIDRLVSHSASGRSLRSVAEEHSQDIEEYRLIASPYQGSGEPLDIFNFEYFGLWDPETKKIMLRTRHGFQVFSDSGDPASQFISTRPVESSPASAAGFERLSSWLETCRASHRKCCEMATSAQRSDMAPARLIRIVDLARGGHFLRLVSTDGLETLPEFLALSYCWGGDQALKCTKATIASLKREIPFAQLAPTLRDAILVCRQASVDYIWVDALCILQDDAVDQALEIAKMPNVYGHALLTIAASRARSANEGFLGTRSVEAATLAFALPYRCKDGNIGAVTLVQSEIFPEPIDFRGWTFQERLLSPRTIEYGTRQTRWLCQESEYKPGFTDGWRRNAESYSLREDTLILPSLRDATESGRSQFGERFTGDWHRVVKTFTRRQLTKSTDRALAISGIAERFASSMDDGCYVAGLWKPYIHVGLLWHIERDGVVARPTAFQGPSWSWTSVNGRVTYPIFAWDQWTPENITLDIISFPGELMDVRAPFGALRPDSARLKVKGRLAPGVWFNTKSTGLVDKGEKMVAFFGANDSEFGGIARVNIFCDTTELDEEEAATGDNKKDAVMVLEIQRSRNGAAWDCCGLVLRRAECNESDNPYEGTVFSRVGAFEFTTNRQGQRDGESEVDWKRRIETEFNWFKNVVPREIEII